jgi:pSer/pThr/pTyr-binding forkhead associated (FHA) protein
MFQLVIQDDEGKTTVVPLIRDEITIGRKEGNTIRLTERNVSRRHARILRNNGEVHIEDLGSYNGIRVNNARIAERVSLRVSDQVQIGDYKLYLKAEGLEQTDEARTIPLDRVESQVPTDAMSSVVGGAPHAIPTTPSPQLIAGQNRIAVADTDPTGRSIGPATAAAVAAMTATGGYGRLVVLSSNFAGKEFELSRPQMIIGRTDENDIVINHRSISRNHAKVVREPETGRYTISDLQSSNGVRVNGQDYGKVELRRGDVIDLGHVRLRFIEVGEDFVFARDAVITDVPEAGSRRGMVVALIAALVVLVAGVVIFALRNPDKTDGKVAPGATGSGTNGATVTEDAGEAVVAIPTTPEVPPETPPVVAHTAARPDDVKAQIAKCTELATQNAWQALDDCATVLGSLGAKDRATEFHDKAKRETENDRSSAEVMRLIREGNLKGAQVAKKQIDDASVYHKAVNDAFTKAENQAVDTARKAAQNYVNAHDCATLRRYVVQLREGSTDKVAGIAAALIPRCVPAQADNPGRQNPVEPATVATPQPPRDPPTPKGQCEQAEVDLLMSQASTQYTAGYSKAALALVVKALACKQDGRMYRFAVTYACAARDIASAKQYFSKVPKEFQPALEQKCQQEQLDIRAP